MFPIYACMHAIMFSYVLKLQQNVNWITLNEKEIVRRDFSS